MVSPGLIRREETLKVSEINEKTKNLFQVIYSEKNKKTEWDDNIPRIRVSDLISRLAFFYEKIRNAVDYEEEYLLRKNAIARILRRQIVIEGVMKEAGSRQISEHLLIELIRAAYLPNNQIPEDRIELAAVKLEKYIFLRNQVFSQINKELSLKTDVAKAQELIKQKNSLTAWLLPLAACEIEESLAPNPVKQAIVDNLFSFLSSNIKLPSNLPYGDDLNIQIYLSVSRTFLKFDEEMQSFVLFKYYNGEWPDLDLLTDKNSENLAKIKKISHGLDELRHLIDFQLNHPLKKQLDKITRVYSLYFSILHETIDEDPAKVYNESQKSEKDFTSLLEQVCKKRYKKAKNRLWKAATRSIIYIFLTKSIFVFLIEIPAIKIFNEPLNMASLAINVSFPALLLFISVFLKRSPGEANTRKIIGGIKELCFKDSPRKQPILLRRPAKRNSFQNLAFNIVYGAALVLSVYLVINFLEFLNFNWVSKLIFLFFLAFVSFFSIRSTKGMTELIVVERKENILTFLLDIFYMPIIMTGRWLSGKFSKINVFIFFFDFIIEAPFKILVQIAEDWSKYVRERRDNIE